ncbi:SPARC-like protein 1 [Heptranchias perlo]|uniref:SPARC-like protein 1 n=1 Tax=Heptranchias perlo TaxID=212740 RepID=UPI00355A7953
MKIAILLTYLAAIGFARPVRKARDLDSNSEEQMFNYNRRTYYPMIRQEPRYRFRQAVDPNNPFYPMNRQNPNYNYPNDNYPNYIPNYNYPKYNNPTYNDRRSNYPNIFNTYPTFHDSDVRRVYYMGASSQQSNALSSELSLEDTSSMEGTAFRLPFENVPYVVPDYEVPFVPGYEVPFVPGYEVPVVPDYEVPAVPGVDTNAVDVGFDQNNSEELATEVSNAEEPARVLPYSDSLQSSDSLGVNLEGDSTIRESNERTSYQEVIYKPTGLDLKNDETLNNEESVDQQVSYENSDEDDPSEENETQNIDTNAVDVDSTDLSNDNDDDNDGTESNINRGDSNGGVAADSNDANGAGSNDDVLTDFNYNNGAEFNTGDGADPSNDGADPSNDGADPSNDGADPSNDGADPSNDGADFEEEGNDGGATDFKDNSGADFNPGNVANPSKDIGAVSEDNNDSLDSIAGNGADLNPGNIANPSKDIGAVSEDNNDSLDSIAGNGADFNPGNVTNPSKDNGAVSEDDNDILDSNAGNGADFNPGNVADPSEDIGAVSEDDNDILDSNAGNGADFNRGNIADSNESDNKAEAINFNDSGADSNEDNDSTESNEDNDRTELNKDDSKKTNTEVDNTQNEVNSCKNFHCKHGRVCELSEIGKPTCICQDMTSCPVTTPEFQHVCGTNNRTYGNACQFFASKCLLEGTKKGHSLHLDYIGPCKSIAPCLDNELGEFPLRLRDWLKNILLQMYEQDLQVPGLLSEKERARIKKFYNSEKRPYPGDQSLDLLLDNFNKNYHSFIYPVHWQFNQLDRHPVDGYLTHSELAPLRAPLIPLEHCTSRFFTRCDTNGDRDISLREWGMCFGIKEEDIDPNIAF